VAYLEQGDRREGNRQPRAVKSTELQPVSPPDRRVAAPRLAGRKHDRHGRERTGDSGEVDRRSDPDRGYETGGRKRAGYRSEVVASPFEPKRPPISPPRRQRGEQRVARRRSHT